MNESEHIVCPACRKINRVARARLYEQPKCGACGDALFSGTPVAVDEAGFIRHMSANTIPVLVDVWAPGADPAA